MTSPSTPPPPGSPSPQRGHFRWGTVAIAAAALGATVAFVTLGPGFGSGEQPSPSPSPETISLTVLEGHTAAEIYELASKTLEIPVAEFEAAAAEPESIGLPPEANGLVEGWLSASPYEIPEAATATDVLSEMVDATLMNLNDLDVAPVDRLEVLTKASLIEKEVSRDEDRPKIARVIENRLAADMPLGFTSTVNYVIGADSDVISAADAKVDSPYNTYLNKGLPPGPICSPSLSSIDAALHPADGTWLYFVTVNLDTGEMCFATTIVEFQQCYAILKEWMAANPD